MPNEQHDPLEETLDADRQHLEALRAAGIPKAFEADAMASIRQALVVANILDVFSGPREAYKGPLWCSACGARYSVDCTCPRYEPPMRGDEDPV